MQRIRSHQTFLLFAGLAALVLAAYAQTRSADLEVYRVDRRAQWRQWTFPSGTLAFSPNGSVTPVEFKGVHNAAANASEFTHELVSGQEMRGGAWKAGSNLATAGRVLDGRANTFWQPDPDAPLEDWWIEINLGRARTRVGDSPHFPRSRGRAALPRIPRFWLRGPPRDAPKTYSLFT